jgi:hypothetical protein
MQISVITFRLHITVLETWLFLDIAVSNVKPFVHGGGQKQVYSCEYAKHGVYSCIIIYLLLYYLSSMCIIIIIITSYPYLWFIF